MSRNECDRGGVRIDHQLIGIESLTFMRRVRSGETESVELAGVDPFQPDVPDIAGLVACRIKENTARGTEAARELKSQAERPWRGD